VHKKDVSHKVSLVAVDGIVKELIHNVRPIVLIAAEYKSEQLSEMNYKAVKSNSLLMSQTHFATKRTPKMILVL
jgi:hypothetical protein